MESLPQETATHPRAFFSFIQNRSRAEYLLIALGAFLVFARFAVATTGDLRHAHDSKLYVQQAELSVLDNLRGQSRGQTLGRPGGYPLFLKWLGHTEARQSPSARAVLRWQAAGSALTLASLVLLGFALFPGSVWRVAWMALAALYSLSECVYPWEAMALSEVFAMNGLLALSALLLFFSLRPTVGVLAVLFLTFWIWVAFKDTLILEAPILALAVAVAWWLRRKELKIEAEPTRKTARLAPAWLLLALAAIGVALGAWMVGQIANRGYRNVNMLQFISRRINRDKPARKLFRVQLRPPDYIANARKVDYWSEEWHGSPERVAWLEDYGKKRHLPFLAKNPRLCLRLFRRASGDVLEALGTGSESYAYWAKDSATDARYPDTIRVRISKAANRAFALPVRLFDAILGTWPLLALPAALSLGALLFPARLGRAPLLPLALFLTGTFYAQYAVSIFYEGTEDSRHALVGTAAFALLAWLACGLAMDKAIRFYKSLLAKPA